MRGLLVIIICSSFVFGSYKSVENPSGLYKVVSKRIVKSFVDTDEDKYQCDDCPAFDFYYSSYGDKTGFDFDTEPLPNSNFIKFSSSGDGIDMNNRDVLPDLGLRSGSSYVGGINAVVFKSSALLLGINRVDSVLMFGGKSEMKSTCSWGGYISGNPGYTYHNCKNKHYQTVGGVHSIKLMGTSIIADSCEESFVKISAACKTDGLALTGFICPSTDANYEFKKFVNFGECTAVDVNNTNYDTNGKGILNYAPVGGVVGLYNPSGSSHDWVPNPDIDLGRQVRDGINSTKLSDAPSGANKSKSGNKFLAPRGNKSNNYGDADGPSYGDGISSYPATGVPSSGGGSNGHGTHHDYDEDEGGDGECPEGEHMSDGAGCVIDEISAGSVSEIFKEPTAGISDKFVSFLTTVDCSAPVVDSSFDLEIFGVSDHYTLLPDNFLSKEQPVGYALYLLSRIFILAVLYKVFKILAGGND